MRMDRRDFMLLFSIGLFSFIPWDRVHAEELLEDWRSVCARWMDLLIPPNQTTPGANTPQIWEHLETIWERDRDQQEWLIREFKALANLPTPGSTDELSEFEVSSPQRFAIAHLHILLAEFYFATEAGWHDLGFAAPPQPGGYKIRRSRAGRLGSDTGRFRQS